MATAQRVFWETVAAIAAVVLIATAWIFSAQRATRTSERLETELASRSQALEAEQRDRQASLEAAFAERAAAQARHEAEAVFDAFSAGITTAAAARWSNYLRQATTEMMAVPRVAFVHLLTPSGQVLASSDPEMMARGRVDDSAAWALAAAERSGRAGQPESIWELAGPVREGERVVAQLWIGYELADGER